ncbi:hypothetical protein OEZ85_001674 [Tetradesmus obliquus]|uniref:SBP-type domain-containing protein n=1 Tax=Tetradesmus obliquus TaxID=3088 RepID=A0ABY8U2V8_TETOB|nr:hypothetical protein OEZ85_001674 [Tetradesmus obliquus]
MVSTGHTSSSSFSDTSQNNHHDSCGTSGRKRDRLCKVVGCSVDLFALNKPYCLKRGVCPQHLKAESVRCKGAGEQLWRFCQQCGKMERLQQFQGKNRSCKAGLARRRQNDAELDAIIAEELLAAGLQIGCGPAGKPTVTPISAPYAQPAAAAAADVAVSGNAQLPATKAAQYAKLHALMAELESLQATLQQLQQEQGVEQQVVSAATRF